MVAVDSLRTHVDHLLRHYDIRLRQWTNDKYAACGNADYRDVVIPEPVCPTTYGICLHEIAHVVLGHRSLYIVGFAVGQENEVDAWCWAFQKSIIGREPLEMIAGVALQTYEEDFFGHRPETLKYRRLMNELCRRRSIERFPDPDELRAAA